MLKTESIFDYLATARKQGLSDDDIRNALIASGWNTTRINAALKVKEGSLLPPPPPVEIPSQEENTSPKPVAVVSSLSRRGFEYVIMFIALGIAAISLGSLLHHIVSQQFGATSEFYDSFATFAAAALIVSFPVFAALFLRLKRAEKAAPQLLHDPSRWRAVQLTLVITFIVGIVQVIAYLFALLNQGTNNGYGYDYTEPQTNVALTTAHAVVTLLIAGGIFIYYWREMQRSKEK